MKKTTIAVCLTIFLLSVPCFAQNQANSKADKVKVDAKALAEIKRQIRLMRAEMAQLEEKIEQITGLHDAVYKTEEVPEEARPAEESK